MLFLRGNCHLLQLIASAHHAAPDRHPATKSRRPGLCASCASSGDPHLLRPCRPIALCTPQVRHIGKAYVSSSIQRTNISLIFVYHLDTGFASSDSAPTLDDPAETKAMDALEEGTRYLEEGNVEAARDHYKRSVGIQKSAAALFNLGVSSAL